MKNFTKFLLPVLCSIAALTGTNANAFQDNPEGCYAMEVIDFTQGVDKNGNAVSTDRSEPNKALMEPDRSNAVGGFFTLGFGGSITLKLAGAVINGEGPDLKIWETTFTGDTCSNSNQESASIEVSDGVNWVSAGDVCRDGMIDLDGLAIPFVTMVRITDLETSPNDGYDVDGVEALNGCIDLEDENLCYASSVVEDSFMQGLTKKDKAVPADRSDATKALGEPEYVYDPKNETFVSLGYGGSIILGFDGVVYDVPGDDLIIAETTGRGANSGASPAWVETAEIFVSQDNVAYYSIGFANKFEAAQLDIADAVDEDGNPVVLEFIRNVKVQDVTPTSSISDDAYDLDGIVALNGCSMDPFEDPEVCNNFDYFIADKKSGENLKIYAANAVDGEAVLTFITEREVPVSIAYDEFTNTLYGINAAGTKIEKINPANGASEGFITVDPGVGSAVFSAVFKNGFLYAGSGTKNQIVKIGLDGSYDVVITGTPINGGDLAFIGDVLYFSTKDGDDLFKVIGGDAVDVGSIPANVHGVSATPDGNFASVAKNSSAIQFLDTVGAVSSSLPARLNGMEFTFTDGDMTGGCNIPANEDPEDDCLSFDYYYADIPVKKSEPTTLYKVNFLDGIANLNLVTELNNRPHIAFNSETNQVYAVRENGSGFETIDLATNSSLGFTAFPFKAKSVTAVAYSNNILYVGSEKNSEIFEYNLVDNTLISIAKDVPVKGGDLVVVGDELYLATKQGGGTWYLISGGDAINAVDIPSEVNGATTTADGTILFANFGADAFKELTADGIVEIPVFLDGVRFTFRHGDLGSGCTSADTQETCNAELVNGGFELENTFSGPIDFVLQEDVLGWSTTSPTGTIEIQRSGLIDGNASNNGDFHFELNGDGLNTLYQEVCTIAGENIAIRFAHKKRRPSGTDKMELYIGGDLASIESNTAIPYIANPNMAWNNNVFVYTVPAGQTSTFIYFKAISGTNNTVGNLLDDISVEQTFSDATDVEALIAALAIDNQPEVLAEVSMYPVPAKDRLNVKLTNRVNATVSYEIVSLLGQTFNRGSVEARSGQNEINADISNLADGTYFFVLNSNGNTITKQFVKVTR